MHALDKYPFEEKMELFYESGMDMLLVCSGKIDVIMSFFEASVRHIERNKRAQEKTMELEAKIIAKNNSLK